MHRIAVASLLAISSVLGGNGCRLQRTFTEACRIESRQSGGALVWQRSMGWTQDMSEAYPVALCFAFRNSGSGIAYAWSGIDVFELREISTDRVEITKDGSVELRRAGGDLVVTPAAGARHYPRGDSWVYDCSPMSGADLDTVQNWCEQFPAVRQPTPHPAAAPAAP